MTWLKTTASRVQLAHVTEITVIDSGPYLLQARTVTGSLVILSGPQNGYETIADALAALDGFLGRDDVAAVSS